MRKSHFLILIFSIISSSLLLGCASQEPSDSKIPWSEPASWEGQGPGFGAP